MTIDKSVMERIKKILSLADKDRNSSDHEAMLAMQRAHELMRKHGLTLADVENDESDSIEISVGTWTDEERSQYDTWVRILAGASCQLFGVQAILHRTDAQNRYRVRYSFIGEETDVQLARSVWPWLVKYCRNSAKAHLGSPWVSKHRSFAESFAARVGARVLEIVKESKRASKQAMDSNEQTEDRKWGLVVQAKESAVQDYIQKAFPKMKMGKMSMRGRHDPEAGRLGDSVGGKVNLNFRSQISGEKSKQITG